MMFKKYILLIGIFAVWTNMLSAESLEERYPSYSYVFSEFDVDTSYIENKEFIAFVNSHEKKLKAFYRRSLKRGKEILPSMQGMLVGNSVSDLFIYLSMVESGFSTKIVSSKKAVGLWQFMPATARQYNLKVCKDTDERCDMVSSTSAAILYLNKLHRDFGKWYLAAMAYNCGEGCLKKAIYKAKSNKIEVLTSNKKRYLPRETRQYIQKILLVAMIGENESLGFVDVDEAELNPIVRVEVAAGTKLKDIARMLKMEAKTLLQLNANIKSGVVSKYKGRKITIPIEKLYAFYLRYDIDSKKHKVEKKTYMVMHRVKLGDTLEYIAKRYHTNIDSIRFANHLEDEFLVVGTFLAIPVNKQIFKKFSH